MPTDSVPRALSLASPSQSLDDMIAEFSPNEKVRRRRTDASKPSWWPLISLSQESSSAPADLVARLSEFPKQGSVSPTASSQDTTPSRGSTALMADLQADLDELDMSAHRLQTPKQPSKIDNRANISLPQASGTPEKVSRNFTLMGNTDLSKEVARLNAELKALKRKQADQVLELEAEVQAEKLAREMSEMETRRVTAELSRLRDDRQDAERRLREAERATMDSEMQVRALTSKVAQFQRAHQCGHFTQGADHQRRHTVGSCAGPPSVPPSPERELEDIVTSIVTFELRQLEACPATERDAGKRRLLRRWHPDKNGGNNCGGGDLATRIMQELQRRPQWTEKQVSAPPSAKQPDGASRGQSRDVPSASAVSPSRPAPSSSAVTSTPKVDSPPTLFSPFMSPTSA